MSNQSQALGTLLIEIVDLAGSAEDHGIVGNPPQDVLGPLIEQAQQLGVEVAPQATLADLHLAVELAAQVIAEQTLEVGRTAATPRASESPAKAAQGFAAPLPQVAPASQAAPAPTDAAPDSKT